MTNTFHVDNNGDVRRCTAQHGRCPYGGAEVHGGSADETRAKYEQLMSSVTVDHGLRRTPAPPIQPFGPDSYYGNVPPRSVQLDALNAVAQALEEDDATQLVAACGTGKSYMGRQLLQHEMSKEDANGISVILTSSIKLASDTAADLRPEGGYDQTMGVYGEDYEVIEVHSGVPQRADELQSVRDVKGTIQADRIRAQLEAAIAEGKHVVIVSTYDSCSKVQEAQAALDDERYAADIIMHDEAHNVLGQQRPTTVASDDNELTAYTGFANEIPGAIQARKRLYATASPVLRETPGDADSPETIEDAIAIAEKMRGGDQWARLTYYSDDAVVGKVSGFISQEEAIQAGCLARPAYAVRESSLKGSLKDFTDPVVGPDGTLMERSASPSDRPLSVNTYGAVKATLTALASDPEGEANPSTNVLAYVGSIDQAEAFKEHFRAVANAEAGNMNPLEAAKHAHSDDPDLRYRARMKLLAAAAEVRAAHSSTDSESVKERRAAFQMFNGKGVVDGEWSPQRRVLANVDIFSEGISISEIDTVVISDDEKCSERAMTQAIGRSIRVLPGNDYKTTGHVIVPSVVDSSGVHGNEASVHLAAYGATRVERAVVANKLRGEGVKPDEVTTFAVHHADGTRTNKLARSYSQEAVDEIMPLAAAAEARSAHTWLMKNEAGYRDATPQEQANMVKSRIADKAGDERLGKANQERLRRIGEHLRGKTAHEMREERRNARVVTSALAVGDVSSLSPNLTAKLIKGGVLAPQGSVAAIGVEEKRAHLAKHAEAVRFAVLSKPSGASELHSELKARLPAEVQADKRVTADYFKKIRSGSSTASTEAADRAFSELMKDDSFVAAAYQLTLEKDEKKLPIITNAVVWKPVRVDLDAQEAAREARQHDEATSGSQSYVVLSEEVTKAGELKSNTLRKLLNL